MTAMRKGWCPGALRPMAAKDGLLVRLRITGGVLPADTAAALADLAERFGNGLFDLSARGNLQMRGVTDSSLSALHAGLAALGLLDADATGEAVRNVLASPLAGLHQGLDIRPLVVALENRLVTDDALHALPGKFGFLIDDGSAPSLAGVEADVRFDWDGERFSIGLGGTRTVAIPNGRCAPPDLPGRAALVAQAFLSIARDHPEARRMRDVARDVAEACARLPSPACGIGWPDDVGSDKGRRGRGQLRHIRPPSLDLPHPTPANAGATFSRKREKGSAGDIVGSHAFASMPVLGLAAPFGRLDASMLRSAARLAETAGLGELRLTPWRVILVPGVTAQACVPGFITDPADPRLAIAACVGADGCLHGTTPTQRDAARLAQDLQLERGTGVRLHVSGCTKGCAKASPSPVTFVAENGRYDIVRDGRPGDPPWRRGLGLDEAQKILAAIMATA